MYSIGDYVRLNGEYEFRKIIAIEIHTYIGYKGKVSVDYILYFGKKYWRSSNAVVEHKKSR